MRPRSDRNELVPEVALRCVKTITIPAASAASTTEGSLRDPPGWMIELDARLDGQLGAVGEGEEGVGRERRALSESSRDFSTARRTESTRLICPAPIPTVARSLERTIALELTCLQTRQAKSISLHSASVGWRSDTTCISERSSESRSRSCTSSPPSTWRIAGSPVSGTRRSSSCRTRAFGRSVMTSSAPGVVVGRDQHLDELPGDRLRRRAVQPAVHRDDAAERADRIAGEGALVGLDHGPPHRHAAGVGVLDDHAGGDLELAHDTAGGVEVEEVVVRELPALVLTHHREQVHARADLLVVRRRAGAGSRRRRGR